MIELEGAIVDWLRDDATLVSLTQHQEGSGAVAADARIMFRYPDKGIAVPSLILVPDSDSDPFVGETIYVSSYNFECYGSSRVEASRILSRVADLFTNKDTLERRIHGRGDISNDEVRVLSTSLNAISSVRLDSELRIWIGFCTVEFRWLYL